jgi:hypothetical protein
MSSRSKILFFYKNFSFVKSMRLGLMSGTLLKHLMTMKTNSSKS